MRANNGEGGTDKEGGTGTWRQGRGWMYAGESSIRRLVNWRGAGGSTTEVGEQTESGDERLEVGAWEQTDRSLQSGACVSPKGRVGGPVAMLRSGLKVRSRETRRDLNRHLGVH